MSARSLPVLAAAATVGALALFAAASPLAAQPFIAVGGFEARVGAAVPTQAEPGFSAGLDADLGWIGIERLRTFVGLNYFVADADRRTAFDEPVRGGFSVLGGHGGLRLDLPTGTRLRPYGRALVGWFRVNASDVDDAAVRDLLEGFYVGAGVGGGLAYEWNPAYDSYVVLEGRRMFVNNVGHWTLELGLRWGPRGDDDREAEAVLERERRRIERERVRTRPPE